MQLINLVLTTALWCSRIRNLIGEEHKVQRVKQLIHGHTESLKQIWNSNLDNVALENTRAFTPLYCSVDALLLSDCVLSRIHFLSLGTCCLTSMMELSPSLFLQLMTKFFLIMCFERNPTHSHKPKAGINGKCHHYMQCSENSFKSSVYCLTPHFLFFIS